MCVYIYMYICICIYIYIYIYLYLYICTMEPDRASIDPSMHLSMYDGTRACIHRSIHASPPCAMIPIVHASIRPCIHLIGPQ